VPMAITPSPSVATTIAPSSDTARTSPHESISQSAAVASKSAATKARASNDGYQYSRSATIKPCFSAAESPFPMTPMSPTMEGSPELTVDVDSACPYIVTFYDAYTDPDQGGSYH
jgi:hypothetical protein